jgi:hypothetical protein
MPTKEDLLDALSDFKAARDSMLHSDDGDFQHHLQMFAKQLGTNPLCRKALENIPEFDVNAWWSGQIDNVRPQWLEALDLPEAKSAQLAIFLYFARSFASNDRTQLSAQDFGSAFGEHARSDALGLTRSLVLRPLADELTRRIRATMRMANPDVRELAGVPLARIPSENELGIFLSHKWINKDLVRRYSRTLTELGFKPWLDEEAVATGDVLHRALAEGMDTSCAAVFFITSAFKDEHWLGREVDLAVNRKVERGGKFQIITLVFDNSDVPRPLREFVFAKVANDLDGLREIIRGLPIELGPARWKKRVVSEKDF